jgi:hypothetical protein
MLSILLVHRLFSAKDLNTSEYYFLAAALGATYLSWEGSGLLFLVYGLIGLILFWRQWPFLRNGHAWIAFGLLIFVVVFQILRRELLKYPFLMAGSGRSSIATPQLASTQPTYDPSYYLEKIYVSEQHVLLTALILIGVIFIRQDKNLRFIYAYLLISLLVYTELLAVYAIRYLYFILPLFLVGSSAVIFRLIDWIGQLKYEFAAKSTRVIGFVCAFIFIPFLSFVLINDGVNLSELRSSYRNSKEWELHPEIARVDFRHVMLKLGRYYREGDIVITRSPFLLELYTGLRGDYTIQSVTIGVVIYDPSMETPYYLDKFVGNPVLRNRKELEDILYKYPRVWFLATPLAPAKKVMREDLFEFVHETMTLVTQGSNVRLYLWENNQLSTNPQIVNEFMN